MKLTRFVMAVSICGVLSLAAACSQSSAPTEMVGTIMKPKRATTDEPASASVAATDAAATQAAVEAAKGADTDASGAATASQAAGGNGNGRKNHRGK